MSDLAGSRNADSLTLPKSPTGIEGLDEVTGGGLPAGRPTLVCGAAGCGKTLLAMEFLVRGALNFNEPGVFMAFEETAEDLAKNVRSLGFDLKALDDQKKLTVDYVYIERSEIEETGQYDLEGLFVRLGYAIDSIGAKRVVLDTLETLFGGLQNEAILRSELRRLFRWLKDKGVTAVITAERGEGTLTRHGLEEYVSDCVILLDHRVTNEMSTRRLRIVKYRGSTHGTNEFPFLIDEGGITVMPITASRLEHVASAERVSSGVSALDDMLGGEGYFRGSSVLMSGTAGTGKTTLAAHFAGAVARRGERCLFVAFEESQSQIERNMRSVGLDLAPWARQGLLLYHNVRPSFHGMEMHLALIYKLLREHRPRAIVIDPVSAFIGAGTAGEVKSMLMRLIDHLKAEGVTAVLTSLTGGESSEVTTETEISSLIDTWLLVRDVETDGERNRGLYVVKSRGMAHSNRIREFVLSDEGVDLVPVHRDEAGGVLIGSARVFSQARDDSRGTSRSTGTPVEGKSQS